MPTARPDTLNVATGVRGFFGRQAVVAVPSWVPVTAWQFVDVPGTTWSAAVKDDGSGVAPASNGAAHSYSGINIFNGSAYSRKNHEFWLFGGGHQQTTNNVLTKTALGSDTPSVQLVCAPSTTTVRNGIFNRTTYLAGNGYWPDGKPISPHSYLSNVYSDSRDEFFSVGLEFVASSTDGTTIGGQAESFYRIPAFKRGDANWQAPGTYADLPSNLQDSAFIRSGPRVLSADGTKIYHWPDGYGLYVFNLATNTHSAIGGTSARPSSVCTNNGSDVSLHIDRSTTGGPIVVKTCNLTTGVQTTLSVSGSTIPNNMDCWGVEYIASLGKYVAVWVDHAAFNTPGATVSSVVIALLTVSGNSVTVATQATTGSIPTKCGFFGGMGYDPTYGCVLLNMDPTQPIKAIKVA